MRVRVSASVFLVAALFSNAPAPGQVAPDYLAQTTVLIIRHAEKPATGSGLTAQGEARARAYVRYFEPFREQNLSLRVDDLYSSADSSHSMRPRLTLEPLSKATGMPLHATTDTKHPGELVATLRSEPHGHTPLIAWRHQQIPALLQAFGASPEKLLPNGIWPDGVFDDVIMLSFDKAGKLSSQRLIHETLQLKPTP
jgi:hypothetical protein